ncbi:ATP synthase F0 subunit C [candidate division WOR-1 bacterium RIFOXYA12_FULL_52_29]|uniref:ATP synthase subunit c n=1 Tax=candidate division WOR-1 bacterium RIFOXYC12_FULL_54_18 TaxID=1802584 RepID=A0A1F4T7N5_UNCSA|nr:MAG: ATP synthase F0 subunit C [candidate division WOR-1 bacterium RIFOXYA2_FULL_51_19]OGC18102.1 MAG: ATP synthase F0 subunit C [candidate division WOR-1 bacterium RIFOXYA12_FULL_52_29]OGC26958.1 MAG: ATP synthase F0 subunit C [candidate division WOR-1 bacterium RIFOXYB2_FULL_45_9]OGC28519.1 MAG: ATP synthase F0 subunit C [candidate division WOR-1 bacterium RIFOXYC12_FULL_54_18]OGC31026.1 MAG: ATP synthase F0 subunit C [candidate division WOR-1 bacterium RIFOXYB12_FULL_52_16]
MGIDLTTLAAGLSIGLVGVGASVGVSMIGQKAIESMSRQPEMADQLRTSAILFIAFIEAIALYALVVSLLLILLK